MVLLGWGAQGLKNGTKLDYWLVSKGGSLEGWRGELGRQACAGAWPTSY